MATGTRIRRAFQSGSLGAGLTAGGTTITFDVAPDFDTLSGDEYIAISLPDGGEVVHLTSYTAAATTGTIERGQEGTSGVVHSNGAPWWHGPTPKDYVADAIDFTAAGAVAATDVQGAIEELDSEKLATTALVDEDDMASDSATSVPSQQSVKAYVDNSIDSVILPLHVLDGTGTLTQDDIVIIPRGQAQTFDIVLVNSNGTTVAATLDSVTITGGQVAPFHPSAFSQAWTDLQSVGVANASAATPPAVIRVKA